MTDIATEPKSANDIVIFEENQSYSRRPASLINASTTATILAGTIIADTGGTWAEVTDDGAGITTIGIALAEIPPATTKTIPVLVQHATVKAQGLTYKSSSGNQPAVKTLLEAAGIVLQDGV